MSRAEFCKGVNEAIADEKAAAALYLKIAKLAPRASISRIVLAIRSDERRHRRSFLRWRRKYC